MLFVCGISFSQVGINTTTPRKTLEVAGDVIISNNIEIGIKRAMTDTDNSTFLIQDIDNKIKSLDVNNPTNDALGYIQEYEIYHPSGDWVLNFDTRIDATLFDVISISAYYNRELKLSNNTDTTLFSLPYTGAFVENGTWRLIADYPSVTNRNSTPRGTWTITTLIFSKDISKQLGTVEIQMNDTTTGSATGPLVD